MKNLLKRNWIFFLASFLLVGTYLNWPVQSQSFPTGSQVGLSHRAFYVEAQDALRFKIFNSAGTGSDQQIKLSLRFRRKSDPNREHLVTRIITPGNDRGATGVANGTAASWPFGAAAGKTRTFTDATTAGADATTLTSAAGAAFIADDVGKTLSCLAAATACSSLPCQGPAFPTTTYNGTITARTSATEVTVKPDIDVQLTNGTCTIEPPLSSDADGLELGPGWITSLDLNDWQGGSHKRGRLWVEGEINRISHNGHEGVTLIKNYQTPSGHLSWPDGNIAEGALSGRGWYRQVVVTVPAAGADWTQSVPTNAHWRLYTVRAALTTSADAANRGVNVQIDDGAGVITWDAATSTVQTASQVTVYQYSVGGPSGTFTRAALTTIYQLFNLPGGLAVDMPEGFRIRSITTNIDTVATADQWGAIVLGVEEWIDP